MLHSESKKPLSKFSPFLVHKVLASVLGDNFKVKRMPSGDLLVEIENKKQSTAVLNLNLVADSRVTEASRRSLNTVWGVIFEDDLLDRCTMCRPRVS